MQSPEAEQQRLSRLYGGMSDTDLHKLADDAGSLSETAVQALAEEARRRGLEIAIVSPAVLMGEVEQGHARFRRD